MLKMKFQYSSFISTVIVLGQLIALILSEQRNHDDFYYKVVDSINSVSNDLFSITLAHKSRNFVCSPLSITQLLSIFSFGARGKTQHELITALRMEKGSISKFTHGKIIKNLQKLREVNLKMEIFMTDTVEINAPFRRLIEEIFQSKIQYLNFNDSKKSTELINTWTKKQTNFKIKKLFDNGSFNNKTSIVLVSTLYFRGQWAIQFKKNTELKLFYVNAKSMKYVPTMSQIGEFNYDDLSDLHIDAKFIKLPYQKDELVEDIFMYIIVPNEKEGLKNVEKDIHKITIDRLQSAFMKNIQVFLPRFKIQTKTDFIDHLIKMQVHEALTQNADFREVNGKANLSITKITQAAFIEVNENVNDEAVPLTAVTFEDTVENKTEDLEIFKINRPFIAILATDDLVLFTARVVDPSL